MARKPEKPPTPFQNNPFAALASRRAELPQGEPVPAEAKVGPARALVRLERKGRRGKEVTVVEKLNLTPGELATWAKELKQALGSGGAVEDEAIVIQGDQRDRVRNWLLTRGVSRVTMG